MLSPRRAQWAISVRLSHTSTHRKNCKCFVNVEFVSNLEWVCSIWPGDFWEKVLEQIVDVFRRATLRWWQENKMIRHISFSLSTKSEPRGLSPSVTVWPQWNSPTDLDWWQCIKQINKPISESVSLALNKHNLDPLFLPPQICLVWEHYHHFWQSETAWSRGRIVLVLSWGENRNKRREVISLPESQWCFQLL